MGILKSRTHQEVEPVPVNPQARLRELNREIRDMLWHEFGFCLKSGRGLGSALVSAVGGGLAIRERHNLEQERDAIRAQLAARRQEEEKRAQALQVNNFQEEGVPPGMVRLYEATAINGRSTRHLCGATAKDMADLKAEGYTVTQVSKPVDIEDWRLG